MKPAESLVSQFFVAGLIYSEFADAKLKRGLRLRLIKDPTNPHDCNAIKVFAPGPKKSWIHLGFVPRNQTGEVRHFRGNVTHATVHCYAPTNATHRMLLVDVFGLPQTEIAANLICT